MKVLVTGSRGFLGKNLVSRLASSKPWDVETLDADLLDPQALQAEIHAKRPEIVINCAAKVGAVRSFQAAPEYLRVNVEGTSNLLEACKAAGTRRFVQISTIEVYGSTFFPTEKSPLHPESPYAVSKASADLLVAAAGTCIETNIVRSTYSYGLHDRPHRMLPFFVKTACAGDPIPLYGDGLHVRDWMSIQDTVLGISLVAEKAMPWETYNLAAANLHNNKELAIRILDILGKPRDRIKHVPDMPGHGRFHGADCRKAREELGFRATTPFEPTFSAIVKAYA